EVRGRPDAGHQRVDPESDREPGAAEEPGQRAAAAEKAIRDGADRHRAGGAAELERERLVTGAVLREADALFEIVGEPEEQAVADELQAEVGEAERPERGVADEAGSGGAAVAGVAARRLRQS